MHTVVALALDGIVAFDLAIPGQVFGDIDERDRYTFAVCAPVAGPVMSSVGYAIHASSSLDALLDADTVIVPGFNTTTPSTAVINALRRAYDSGSRIVSICTGAFALAAAGLLDGCSATTHWAAAEAFASSYPHVHVDPSMLFLQSAPRVFTSAGIAAGIDLCLHLIELDHGAAVANRVARRMVTPTHREGGQAQFIEHAARRDNTSTGFTHDWIRAHLDDALTVSDMAAHAQMSPRTFARRFVSETGTTPRQWLVRERLNRARILLENSQLSVEEIANCCGFGTASNLRSTFTATLKTTPSRYRHSFRQA